MECGSTRWWYHYSRQERGAGQGDPTLWQEQKAFSIMPTGGTAFTGFCSSCCCYNTVFVAMGPTPLPHCLLLLHLLLSLQYNLSDYAGLLSLLAVFVATKLLHFVFVPSAVLLPAKTSAG